MAAVHVIGAGMAGLACAVALAGRGMGVNLYEAAAEAGGRCRSFHDRVLGRVVDNGTHVIFGGNRATFEHLRQVGAEERLVDAGPLVLADLASGSMHRLDASRSRWPRWVFSRDQRPPGTRAWHYGSVLRVLAAAPHRTVADIVKPDHPLFRGFWQPLTLAALNAPLNQASARLLGTVLRRTLAQGGEAAKPFLVRDSLAGTFVAPSLAWLGKAGAAYRSRARLRGIQHGGGQIRRLVFDAGTVEVADAQVVLAVPPAVAAKLIPGLVVPHGGYAIANLHLAVGDASAGPRLIGLIGGKGHWLAVREGLMTVTVSAADNLLEGDTRIVAAELWGEAQRALGWSQEPLPPWRLVKERAATFRPDPGNLGCRPGPRTAYRNLWLAGDWTDTGLPATIESAVVSGRRAAAALIAAQA